jgi:hypothetical protein
MATKLELEFRDDFKKSRDTLKVGNVTVMMTPQIDEDYWVFRVKLFKDQALVAFPKFGTIGIGFAVEDNWNTNLPWTCETKEIFNHIKENRKYKEISDKTCLLAIHTLQKASEYYVKNEQEEKDKNMVVDVNPEAVYDYVRNLRKFAERNKYR